MITQFIISRQELAKLMSRNKPNEVDDPLLASAKSILKSSKAQFVIKPWREIMATKNGAMNDRTKAVSAAAKRLKAGEAAPGVKAVWPTIESGVDKPHTGVVHSIHDPKPGSINPTLESTMTKPEVKKDPAANQAAKEAAVQAKIAAKEKANAEKAAKKAEREKAQAEAKAERDAAIADKRAAAEADGSKRTYFGPMLQLSEKVKNGAYVKGTNGQLRSNDPVALVLEACSPKNVVMLLKQCLVPLDAALATKYNALNIGQQSMNLRNKLRGFIKTGKITIDVIKEARDAGNFADAEAAAAEKKVAADKRAAEKAAKKADPKKEVVAA